MGICEYVCNLGGGENMGESNNLGKKVPADEVGINFNMLGALLKHCIAVY